MSLLFYIICLEFFNSTIKSIMSTIFFLSALPEPYTAFRPLVDVMPAIPVLFLLLAFIWQASVGFR